MTKRLDKNAAQKFLEKLLGHSLMEAYDKCTGDSKTCNVPECIICGIMDCPGREPLHYHHDGCPYCYHHETKQTGERRLITISQTKE